jgi:hypothetical protein
MGVLHGAWLARVPSGRDGQGEAVYERPAVRPMVKLSREDAAEIRRLYQAGWLQREIAALFDVTQSHISKVVAGVAWPE